MPKNLFAEVFGFPPESISSEAKRHREHQLCPYNNIGPNCTKDKKDNPLGVCSIWHGEKMSIVCPIRFRERWLVAEQAAEFLFPKGSSWTFLPEVRLADENQENVGKIDFVLVAYDKSGIITNYGALEIQSVYISGNLRTPFEKYREDPKKYSHFSLDTLVSPPHPDHLSSRKRLIPQLHSKGRFFRKWGRRMAVAVDEAFFESLPRMSTIAEATADLAWLVYGLEPHKATNSLRIELRKAVYTDLRESLAGMMEPPVGPEEEFLAKLQKKLSSKLQSE